MELEELLNYWKNGATAEDRLLAWSDIQSYIQQCERAAFEAAREIDPASSANIYQWSDYDDYKFCIERAKK